MALNCSLQAGAAMSNDIVDTLPHDPFGMGVRSTVTITGWFGNYEVDCQDFENFEVDYQDFGSNSEEEYKLDLFADLILNWKWNNAMRFQSISGNNKWFDEKLENVEGNRHNEKKISGYGLAQNGYGSLNQQGDAFSRYGFGSLGRHEEKDFGAQYGFGSLSRHEEKDFGAQYGFGSLNRHEEDFGVQYCSGSLSRHEEEFGAQYGSLSRHEEKDFGAQYCSGSLNPHDEKEDSGNRLDRYGSGSSRDVGDIPGSSGEDTREKADNRSEGNFQHGDSHEALDYVTRYLGLKDLLSMERVCKHLYTNVRSDNSVWRSIHVDQPLNERITDDILLQLTNRAEGNLQCLSLVECQRVTDDGVRRVLETNPRLTKLCVPGCTRISIAAIVNNVKAFNSKKGTVGIKHLRIGGLYCITQEHFEELTFLLGTDRSIQKSGHKPRFYHLGNLNLLRDDDCAIDVETCPRCGQPRMVYDCPAEGCQMKDHTTEICRACTLCIARCAECGRCVNDNEYEETFNLDLLCSDCSLAATEVLNTSD